MGINSTIRSLASLGERLKSERARLGWTREEMAGYGEVSRASQRLYDSSNRIPSLTYLLLLTKAGADFNYLLHGDRSTGYPEDFVHMPRDALAKSFQLTCEIWESDSSRVSTIEDAKELFMTLCDQLSEAEATHIDVDTLIYATRPDKKKA